MYSITYLVATCSEFDRERSIRGGSEVGISIDVQVQEYATRIFNQLPCIFDSKKTHPETFKVSFICQTVP